MPTTSVYQIKLDSDGSIDWSQVFESVSNTVSPVNNTIQTLPTGDTTIYAGNFTAAGLVTRAFVILPPVDNTTAIILKGNAADVGVTLNPSNPSIVGVNPAGAGPVILNVATTIQGVRIIRI